MVELLDLAVEVHGGMSGWKARKPDGQANRRAAPAVAIDFTAVKAA